MKELYWKISCINFEYKTRLKNYLIRKLMRKTYLYTPTCQEFLWKMEYQTAINLADDMRIAKNSTEEFYLTYQEYLKNNS